MGQVTEQLMDQRAALMDLASEVTPAIWVKISDINKGLAKVQTGVKILEDREESRRVHDER